MKTPPLYFVRTIFCFGTEYREGRSVLKDASLTARKGTIREKPNSLPNILADRGHRNCGYKLENVVWFGQHQELLMPDY